LCQLEEKTNAFSNGLSASKTLARTTLRLEIKAAHLLMMGISIWNKIAKLIQLLRNPPKKKKKKVKEVILTLMMILKKEIKLAA
jgi:hypothetical protein